jgi:hypothetical protein
VRKKSACVPLQRHGRGEQLLPLLHEHDERVRHDELHEQLRHGGYEGIPGCGEQWEANEGRLWRLLPRAELVHLSYQLGLVVVRGVAVWARGAVHQDDLLVGAGDNREVPKVGNSWLWSWDSQWPRWCCW